MTQGAYSQQAHEYPWGTVGPLHSAASSGDTTGLPLDEIHQAIETGVLRCVRISRHTLRLHEREVGERFGMPLPGPREIHIAAEYAERQAQKLMQPPKQPRAIVDHWLYWFYDAEGLLLYVGITNTGVRRMEQHGADKEWWPQVATINVNHFRTRDEAEAAEVEAIRAHLPVHNVRDSVRFRKGRLC